MMNAKSVPKKSEGFSIFSYGFRPFFLGAGIYAILPIIPWALYLGGLIDPQISLQSWHAHEMLFGFVAAGISGFLLTSIPKWTSTPPLTGAGLKRLFYFWIAGRIAFWLYLFIDHPLMGYLLFLDLLLPIAQALRITRIFVITKIKRNFIFIAMLICLACANLMVILDMNGWTSGTAGIASTFAPNVIMIMIAIIAGRIIPNFTRSYVQLKGDLPSVRSFRPLEMCAIGILLLQLVSDLVFPHTALTYGVALSAAFIHLLRFSGWNSFQVVDNPILWVLHIGYVWFILSLFLKGAEGWLNLPYHLYLHAFILGTIGMFILGIMSRASLGHTGRALQVSRGMTAAYVLMAIAAVARTTAPFIPQYNVAIMEGVILIWIASFLLFLRDFVPILTSPRIDGKPG